MVASEYNKTRPHGTQDETATSSRLTRVWVKGRPNGARAASRGRPAFLRRADQNRGAVCANTWLTAVVFVAWQLKQLVP